MERILRGYCDGIGYAFNLLPGRIRDMLCGVEFLTGTDPVWAGLHDHDKSPYPGDIRSYRNTAHVSYPWNALNKKGKTTVVLPLPDNDLPWVIIHELGHCLDEVIGFEHEAVPINDYAQINRLEAFAESFAAQYFWYGDKAEEIRLTDIPTLALWHRLEYGD